MDKVAENVMQEKATICDLHGMRVVDIAGAKFTEARACAHEER
jgi:hypothetical protein